MEIPDIEIKTISIKCTRKKLGIYARIHSDGTLEVIRIPWWKRILGKVFKAFHTQK